MMKADLAPTAMQFSLAKGEVHPDGDSSLNADNIYWVEQGTLTIGVVPFF